MMRFILHFSFYRRLQISFLALILLPIIFASSLSYYNTQQSIRENIKLNNERVVSLLAGELAKMSDDVIYASNFFIPDNPYMLTQLRAIRRATGINNFEDYQHYIAITEYFNLVTYRTLNNRINMFVANPQGFIIQSSQGAARSEEIRLLYEQLKPMVDLERSMVIQWLGMLPEEGGSSANDYYAARVIRDPADNSWLATMYAVIPYRLFEQLLESAEDENVALYDNECRLIAGKAGVSCEPDTANFARIRSEQKIAKNGWKLVYETPEAEVTGEIKRNFYYSMIIIASCACLFFLISVWIARRLYQPIRQLKQGVKRFGEGELSVRFNVRSGDEMEELGNTLNTMVDQINRLIVNIEKEQDEKREMELRALSSQIHPHFLINTLNSVKYSLIMDNNEYHSQKIASIMNLLRAYMKFNEPSTIQSECILLHYYVDIMKMRNEMDIELVVELAPDTEEVYVPKLLLQPLVENAIVHGFSGETERPRIVIRSYRTANLLTIEIEDNGSGCDREQRERLNRLFAAGHQADLEEGYGRVGMVNVYLRLRRTFGDGVVLQLLENETGGTTVVVQFPDKEGGEPDVEGFAGG